MREVRVERLVGRKVRSRNGRVVGHLEEIVAEKYGTGYLVTEFHMGTAAMEERMGHIMLLFGAGHRRKGFAARPDQLDLRDPDHPRLLCEVDELRRIGDGEQEPDEGPGRKP